MPGPRHYNQKDCETTLGKGDTSMNNIGDRKLNLVSFANPIAGTDLLNHIVRLDYDVNLIKSLNEMNRELPPTNPMVIFLGDNNNRKPLFVDSLQSNLEFPSLAVLQAKTPTWNDKILDLCNDFLVWPCSDRELTHRLDRMISLSDQQDLEIDEELTDTFSRHRLLGRSPSFVKVLRSIQQILNHDVTVLIDGATGTGKELVARVLHYCGPRKGCPFVPVNCGSIPDSLFENEFFGHARGAFTDAKSASEGLIEQAQEGTLFLDEIEALSAKGQVSLLRFLQSHEYRPLGSKQLKRADVRIIAATNTNLNKLVDTQRFRRDLWYRLNIVQLGLPSLCEREEDIELLANHFLQVFTKQYNLEKKTLHPSTIFHLYRYHWPGNIRELENFIHRSVLMANNQSQIVADPSSLDSSPEVPDVSLSFRQAKAEMISRFERAYLMSLMEETQGNVSKAAKLSGKERRALGKLLKKHGIDRKHYLNG